MTDDKEDLSDNDLPDRPLECSGCKKPLAVRYTEILGESIIHTSMCADCPELKKRLHGPSPLEAGADNIGNAGLACGECGTTLDSLLHGFPLGCSHCYEVFGDVILSELITIEKIPLRLHNSKKSTPIHIGRGPGESQEMSPQLRLLSLSEALSETLKREDYEQAAWLRDQIKALTEENPENTDERK